MNLKELIAKFQKEGYAALTEQEKDLLSQNASMMSKALQTKFNEGVDEDEKKDEDAAAAAGAGADEDKGDAGEKGDENVDEKALSALISKHVNTQVAAKVEEVSKTLAEKFMAGAKAQRRRILSGEEKASKDDHSETRNFLKALITHDHEKAAQFNEDANDARGGYTVPPSLLAEVIRILPAGYGVARRDMRYLPFSGPSKSRTIPTLASSVIVNWTDEGAKKTGTNPTFGIVTQTLKKLAAIIPFTEEILEDSAINLTQLVAQLFAEAVSKEEDIQFFTGTGSPWTGILHNGDVNDVPYSGLYTTTAFADALLEMQDATPSGALAGAKYYMHRSVLNLVRKLKDSQNHYVYQAPGEGQPGTLWNYPVELCEAFPAAAGIGEMTGGLILFGNLNLGAVLGDKQQIRAKVLDQATITDGDGETIINLAEQDMIALRLEERVGYVLTAPKALTILTPTRGS